MSDFAKKLPAQRDHVIAEIHAAFKNVRRGNGVSWEETYALDDWGDEKAQRAARAKDPDRPWTELVNDPAWDPRVMYGGWSFLDAEGFRYYLPPAMIREAMIDDPHGATSFFVYSLTFPKPAKDPKRDLRAHTLKKWSLLDDRQRRCVKRFLEFKVACARAHHDAQTAEFGFEIHPFHSEWLRALESHWTSSSGA